MKNDKRLQQSLPYNARLHLSGFVEIPYSGNWVPCPFANNTIMLRLVEIEPDGWLVQLIDGDDLIIYKTVPNKAAGNHFMTHLPSYIDRAWVDQHNFVY